jgi:hypothetical protein
MEGIPSWQVLRVALLFLSPLKPVLVEGVWDRVRSRLAPLEAEGASQYEGFLEQPQCLMKDLSLTYSTFKHPLFTEDLS